MGLCKHVNKQIDNFKLILKFNGLSFHLESFVHFRWFTPKKINYDHFNENLKNILRKNTSSCQIYHIQYTQKLPIYQLPKGFCVNHISIFIFKPHVTLSDNLHRFQSDCNLIQMEALGDFWHLKVPLNRKGPNAVDVHHNCYKTEDLIE